MVLEIDNIELSFGSKQILHGIYLKAEQGKITALLGRNGFGKTSLLNIIFGSLKPKYASIRIDGKNSTKPLFAARNVAYLPQHALLPKTIKLVTAFNLFQVDWQEFISRFQNFSIYKNIPIAELSSGEMRLVETYLILSKDCDIILLDEPFSFIAPVYIEQLKERLLELKKEKTIIITDHYYQAILSVGDSIYLLKDGSSKFVTNQESLIRVGYLPFNPQ